MLCIKIVLNVKTKTTICVHNMSCRYSELTIFMNNEQSVVILWVSWCTNKSFWQRFTCTYEFNWFSTKAHITYDNSCPRLVLRYVFSRLIRVVHKLRWHVFGFLDHPPLYVDIFYQINIDKKLTFLNYLPTSSSERSLWTSP